MNEKQTEIEIAVLAAMGLPNNAVTLDGDSVLANRSDYKPSDEEREEFKRLVLERVELAKL